jgi:hypothetical protein
MRKPFAPRAASIGTAILCTVLALSGCGGKAISSATSASRAESAPPKASEASRSEDSTSETSYPTPRGALPVIIVPGIAGSELALAGSGPGATAELAWPPFDASRDNSDEIKDFPALLSLVGKAVRRLDALEMGSGERVSAVIDAGANALDAYAPLERTLMKARGRENVYFFAYDWRLDNGESASRLGAYVEKVKRERGVAKVDLVAHSMGGLIVSAYLAKPGAAESLHRIVIAGSPLEGSGSAYSSLAGTSVSGGESTNPVLALALPDSLITLATREGTSAQEIASGLEKTMVILMRGYPSVYELLTSRDSRRLAEIGLPDSVSAAEAIAKAISFRTRVGSRLREIYGGAGGVSITAMVGTGMKTLEAAGGAGSDEPRYLDGDGLVTPRSATSGGILRSRAKSFATSHLGLVQDQACLDFIARTLAR